MSFYRLWKPKAKISTFEETMRIVIDNWKPSSSNVHIEGIPLYIVTDRDLISLYYADIKITIFIDIVRLRFKIQYNTIDDTGNEWNSFEVRVQDEEVHFRENDKSDPYNFNIHVPFDALNEIDFFQYETLNPVLPIEVGTIQKFVKLLINNG